MTLYTYTKTGELIGTVTVGDNSSDVNDNALEIEHIHVQPEYQGKGYGKELMNMAEEYIKSKKPAIKMIVLNPWSEREKQLDIRGLPTDSLVRWYQSQGYDWPEGEAELLKKEFGEDVNLIPNMNFYRKRLSDDRFMIMAFIEDIKTGVVSL